MGGDRGGGGGGDSGDGDSGGDDGDDGGERDFGCSDDRVCLPVEDPEITVDDIASFYPADVTVSMEPDGWMIVGLPANFIADANVNTQEGVLFDIPVFVRFTPTAYVWSWGDGTSSTTTTGGATWDELGQAELTDTATSHVYAEKGSYSISIRVQYAADVRSATSVWFPVEGTVTGPADVLTATAATAKSVIVDKDCNQNPAGPGCP